MMPSTSVSILLHRAMRIRRQCKYIIYGGIITFVFVYINLFIIAHQRHDEFAHGAGNDPELWLDYAEFQRSKHFKAKDAIEKLDETTNKVLNQTYMRIVNNQKYVLYKNNTGNDAKKSSTLFLPSYSEHEKYLLKLMAEMQSSVVKDHDVGLIDDQLGRETWLNLVENLTARKIPSAQNLSRLLKYLSSGNISVTDLGHKGTQLKLTLFIGDYKLKAAFKPKRYERQEIIDGTPYAGMDRHNGEIASFHLGRLLKLDRTPPVAGRVVHMKKELFNVASESLKSTFIFKSNETCVYGKCYYCKPSYAACSDADERMEGAVILWLPDTWRLKSWRHPWARTYREGKLAMWERDPKYCSKVVQLADYDPARGPRLLDLVDAAMFDFIVGNADRHMYETFEGRVNSTVLLLDNGKSFGNPFHDEYSILAPLYQCCMVRQSTWDWLSQLSGDWVATALEKLTNYDPIAPVLATHHYPAIARRFNTVVAAVNKCIAENGEKSVLMDDGF